MKKGLTEIIFVVDRSGSMESIRTDMIGGFNAFLKEQRKVPTECKVSFYQFDTTPPIPEKVYERVNLKEVKDLTLDTFVPRGGTPLLDAVANVIRSTGERLKNTDESERPEKVLVVCITDGEENSSREWNGEQVKQMIEHQEQNYKWEFVYLGANQNAWATGTAFGFKGSSTLGYVASKGGVDNMFKSLADKVTSYRCCAEVSSVSFDEADRAAQKDEGYQH